MKTIITPDGTFLASKGTVSGSTQESVLRKIHAKKARA
jgi:hypothetical protein